MFRIGNLKNRKKSRRNCFYKNSSTRAAQRSELVSAKLDSALAGLALRTFRIKLG